MSTVDAELDANNGLPPGLRFIQRMAFLAVSLMASFGPAVSADDSAIVPLEAAIDASVESNAVGPLAPVCSDADFLRRISIDLVGAIPTVDRVRTFLADSSPDKRARLVDELLAAPAHARHFALLLDGMLL